MKHIRLKLFCILFATSLAFPITASVKNMSYRVIGYVEMIFAITLAVMAISVYVRRSSDRIKGTRRLTIDIYKIIFSIPLLLLTLFLFDVDIKWDVLLVGFSWRFWLLSFILEDLVLHFKKSKSRRWNSNYQ